MAKLTIKQENFCLEYIKCGNASEAYRAAYNAEKMKPASVHRNAHAMLENTKVASRIEQLRSTVIEKVVLDQERVLSELAAMAFYDPADLVRTPINKPADIANLPERVRRCIIGWSWDRNGNFVLKLANKTANADLIARHLGMFVDRKEVRVGKLETATDAELEQAILESARQLAESEGVPVESVMAELAKMRAPAQVH